MFHDNLYICFILVWVYEYYLIQNYLEIYKTHSQLRLMKLINNINH